MSETNAAVASPAPKTAKKAKQVASNGKAVKSALSPQRALVVKALKKRPNGSSLEQIVATSGVAERAAYHHVWHLRKDGLVKNVELDVDGKREVIFALTARGSKLVV